VGLLSAFSRDFLVWRAPASAGAFLRLRAFLRGFWEDRLLAGGFSWVANGKKYGDRGLWTVVLGVLKNRHFFRFYFWVAFSGLLVAYTQCIVSVGNRYAL